MAFGRKNSEAFTAAEVMMNVDAFLNQDADNTWVDEAEPHLKTLRKEAVRADPPGTSALASAVSKEVQAWASAGVGAWSDAAAHAHEVARLVGVGGRDTAGYRAFWMYLEAAWSDQAAADAGDVAGRATAGKLVRQAERIQALGSWVREMATFPAMERSPLGSADAAAVAAIVAKLTAGVRQSKIRRHVGEIHVGLGKRSPSEYEPALTQLGKLVGANVYKRKSSGRCDSVWLWDNHLWLALEAKSDHEPSGVVSQKEVRQANDQLRLLASDENVPQAPEGSATIIISPKPGIDVDGTKGAESHVHLVAPSVITEIAFDVESAWEDLMTKAPGREPDGVYSLVVDVLRGRGILPTLLHERLTQDAVNSSARDVVAG